jgi:hypothetical protein
MLIRIFGLFALAFALFGTPCRAQCGGESQPPCISSITDSFSPGTTTGTFDFTATGDGVITFQFETVLTSFQLTVTANKVISITNLDPTEFPNTVCIPYTTGFCDRYDVTGTAGGPNGVPIRGVDYRGLIAVTLTYDSFIQVDIPAFGHAPDDNAGDIFSEDILTSYVDPNAPSFTPTDDPSMGGKTPGISSFAALNKHFANSAQGDIVCPNLTAMPQTSSSGQNPIVEVSFKLVSANGSCSTSTPLRDKTATLSVGQLSNGRPVAVSLVNGGDSNKFHFDNSTGLNVQDINTNGLTPGGSYFVTVISTLFSPVTAFFTAPMH